jgi:hypothetical protein
MRKPAILGHPLAFSGANRYKFLRSAEFLTCIIKERESNCFFALKKTNWHARIDGVMILGEILFAGVRAEGQFCWRLLKGSRKKG